MSYPITHLSACGEHALQHNSTGFVHSVYRKTVNIIVSDQLLALQTHSSPLSPISLITNLSQEDMENLTFCPGQRVLVSPQKIIIPADSSRHTFTWDTAQIHDLKLHSDLKKKQIFELKIKIKNVLSSASTGGFEILFQPLAPPELSLVLSAAKKYIDSSTCSLAEKNYDRAANFLCRLIGLGTGLTPSGDDFLCGLLAGLRLQSQTPSALLPYLTEKISEHLTDTNDISAAFLSCALKGQYSIAVNSLCRLPDAKAILTSFLAIGHSSGIDTLCGVLYGLETFDM